MICNYQNINDFCSKQYSYSFIDVVSNNGVVDIDKSENASVLRTDNFTGTTKILSPNSIDSISTCSSSDDNEGVTEWECYLIYRYVYNGVISDPPLDILKNGQKNIINDAYESSLSEGIQVTINNQPVVLASSLNDQIVYKSILSYAQALYDDDTDAIMPVFTDINSNQYSLLYDDFILVFKEYFTKVIYYKNLKDTLINEVDKALSLNDCQNINWCSTKPLVGNLIPTKITSTNIKNAIQDCDPPPPSCEEDIDCSLLGLSADERPDEFHVTITTNIVDICLTKPSMYGGSSYCAVTKSFVSNNTFIVPRPGVNSNYTFTDELLNAITITGPAFEQQYWKFDLLRLYSWINDTYNINDYNQQVVNLSDIEIVFTTDVDCSCISETINVQSLVGFDGSICNLNIPPEQFYYKYSNCYLPGDLDNFSYTFPVCGGDATMDPGECEQQTLDLTIVVKPVWNS